MEFIIIVIKTARWSPTRGGRLREVEVARAHVGGVDHTLSGMPLKSESHFVQLLKNGKPKGGIFP